MPGTVRDAVHRTMVLVDVEGYSAPTRTLPHQLGTRAGMYAVVAEALQASGVPWDACSRVDAGDGVAVLVPPQFPKAPLVEVLPEALARAVRGHNNTSHEAARARLRLAIHAGEVVFDDNGATSPSMVAAFRLLDAAPVREALAGSPGVLALVVSRVIFDEVVRNSTTLDPATFRPIKVAVKQFHDLAWVALPDRPYPAEPAVLDQQSSAPTPDPASGGRTRASSDIGAGGNSVTDLGAGTRGVSITGEDMDAELTGLAATAATTVVRLLATQAWQTARDGIVALWQKVHPDKAERIGLDLDEAREQLAGVDGTEDVAAALKDEWRGRLATLLTVAPTLAGDLRRMLDTGLTPALERVSPGVAESVRQSATATDHSTVVQAGHSVHVTGSINRHRG